MFCGIHGLTPDTKKHLYINTKKGVYYCQRCSHSGKWKGGDLPTEVWLPKKDKYKDVELFPLTTGFNKEKSKVIDYCLGRLPEEVVYERVRWSPQITNRAFFPVYSEGELCIWQGRAIEDWIKPKYLTWGPCSQYLYNFEYVTDKWGCITEGPVDALSVPNGVALFGKDMSDIQMSMIVSKFDKVYWCLDGDTKNQKRVNANKDKLRNFIEVVNVPLAKDEDCNSVGYEEMERRICESVLVAEGPSRK